MVIGSRPILYDWFTCVSGAWTDSSKKGWRDELRTESFDIVESSSHLLSALVARRDQNENLHPIGRLEADKKVGIHLKAPVDVYVSEMIGVGTGFFFFAVRFAYMCM